MDASGYMMVRKSLFSNKNRARPQNAQGKKKIEQNVTHMRGDVTHMARMTSLTSLTGHMSVLWPRSVFVCE